MWEMMKNTKQEFSYKDIKEREGQWELINGIPYLLASPSYEHQRMIGELHLQLANFFKDGECRVILSPFDVQLDEEKSKDDSKNIVQPDLIVVCEPKKIMKNRLKGSPDLVIEILSKSTGLRDRNQKYYLYEKSGVTEYWMLDPSNRTVEVLGLTEGKYQLRKVFGPEDTLTSILFSNLEIDLSSVFN